MAPRAEQLPQGFKIDGIEYRYHIEHTYFGESKISVEQLYRGIQDLAKKNPDLGALVSNVMIEDAKAGRLFLLADSAHEVVVDVGAKASAFWSFIPEIKDINVGNKKYTEGVCIKIGIGDRKLNEVVSLLAHEGSHHLMYRCTNSYHADPARGNAEFIPNFYQAYQKDFENFKAGKISGLEADVSKRLEYLIFKRPSAYGNAILDQVAKKPELKEGAELYYRAEISAHLLQAEILHPKLAASVAPETSKLLQGIVEKKYNLSIDKNLKHLKNNLIIKGGLISENNMRDFIGFFEENNGIVTKSQLIERCNVNNEQIQSMMRNKIIVNSKNEYSLHSNVQKKISKNFDNIAILHRHKQCIVPKTQLIFDDQKNLEFIKNELKSLGRSQNLLIESIEFQPNKNASGYLYELKFHPARYANLYDKKNCVTGLQVIFDGAKELTAGQYEELILQAEKKGNWEEGAYYRSLMKKSTKSSADDVQKVMKAIENEVINKQNNFKKQEWRIEKISGEENTKLNHIKLDKNHCEIHKEFHFDPKNKIIELKSNFVNDKNLIIHQEATEKAINHLNKNGSNIITVTLKRLKFIGPIVTIVPVVGMTLAGCESVSTIVQSDEPGKEAVKEGLAWSVNFIGAGIGGKIGAQVGLMTGNPYAVSVLSVGGAIAGAIGGEEAVRSLMDGLEQKNVNLLEEAGKIHQAIKNGTFAYDAESPGAIKMALDSLCEDLKINQPINYGSSEDNLAAKPVNIEAVDVVVSDQQESNSYIKSKESILEEIDETKNKLEEEHEKFAEFSQELLKQNSVEKKVQHESPVFPVVLANMTSTFINSLASLRNSDLANRSFMNKNAAISEQIEQIEALTGFKVNLDQFRYGNHAAFYHQLPMTIYTGYLQSITEASDEFSRLKCKMERLRNEVESRQLIDEQLLEYIKHIHIEKQKCCRKLEKLSYDSRLPFARSSSELIGSAVAIIPGFGPPLAFAVNIISTVIDIAENNDQAKIQKKADKIKWQLDELNFKENCKNLLRDANEEVKQHISLVIKDIENKMFAVGESSSPKEYRQFLHDQKAEYEATKDSYSNVLACLKSESKALLQQEAFLKNSIDFHQAQLEATSDKKNRKHLEKVIQNLKNNLTEHQEICKEIEVELTIKKKAVESVIDATEESVTAYTNQLNDQEELKNIYDWYYNDKMRKYEGLDAETKAIKIAADRKAAKELSIHEKEWYDALSALSQDTHQIKDLINASQTITSALRRYWGFNKPAVITDIAETILESGKIISIFISPNRKFSFQKLFDYYKKHNNIIDAINEFKLEQIFTEIINPSINLVGLGITLFALLAGVTPKNPVIDYMKNRFDNLEKSLKNNFLALHTTLNENFSLINAKMDAHFAITARTAENMFIVKYRLLNFEKELKEMRELVAPPLFSRQTNEMSLKQYRDAVNAEVRDIELLQTKKSFISIIKALIIRANHSDDISFASKSFDPYSINVSIRSHLFIDFLANHVNYSKKLPNFKIFYSSVYWLSVNLNKFWNEYKYAGIFPKMNPIFQDISEGLNEISGKGKILKGFLHEITGNDSSLLRQINNLQAAYSSLLKKIESAQNSEKLNDTIQTKNQRLEYLELLFDSYNHQFQDDISKIKTDFVGFNRYFLQEIFSHSLALYFDYGSPSKKKESIFLQSLSRHIWNHFSSLEKQYDSTFYYMLNKKQFGLLCHDKKGKKIPTAFKSGSEVTYFANKSSKPGKVAQSNIDPDKCPVVVQRLNGEPRITIYGMPIKGKDPMGTCHSWGFFYPRLSIGSAKFSELNSERENLNQFKKSYNEKVKKYLDGYTNLVSNLLNVKNYEEFQFNFNDLIVPNCILILPSSQSKGLLPLVFSNEHIALFRNDKDIQALYDIQEANKGFITHTYDFFKIKLKTSKNDEYHLYLNFHVHLTNKPSETPFFSKRLLLATFDVLTVEAVKKIIPENGFTEIINLNEFLLPAMYGTSSPMGIANKGSNDVTGKGAIFLKESAFIGLFRILLVLPSRYVLRFNHLHHHGLKDRFKIYSDTKHDKNDIRKIKKFLSEKEQEDSSNIIALLPLINKSSLDLKKIEPEYKVVCAEYEALIGLSNLTSSVQSNTLGIVPKSYGDNLVDPKLLEENFTKGFDYFHDFVSKQRDILENINKKPAKLLEHLKQRPSKLSDDLDDALENLDYWIKKFNFTLDVKPPERNFMDKPKRFKPMSQLKEENVSVVLNAKPVFCDNEVPLSAQKIIPVSISDDYQAYGLFAQKVDVEREKKRINDPYHKISTTGDGDCAFHAVRGAISDNGECHSKTVENDRKMVADVVNNFVKLPKEIREIIIFCIQQTIMEGERLNEREDCIHLIALKTKTELLEQVNWDDEIKAVHINEYASLLEPMQAYLYPGELGILAYAFNVRIEYVQRTVDGNHVSCDDFYNNKPHLEKIMVAHNGESGAGGHFYRVVRKEPEQQEVIGPKF